MVKVEVVGNGKILLSMPLLLIEKEELRAGGRMNVGEVSVLRWNVSGSSTEAVGEPSGLLSVIAKRTGYWTETAGIFPASFHTFQKPSIPVRFLPAKRLPACASYTLPPYTTYTTYLLWRVQPNRSIAP